MNNIQQTKVLLLYIFILFFAGVGISQEISANSYGSEKLRNIAERLSTDYHLDCNNNNIKEIDGLSIIIQKDLFGKITQIGFKLFPDELTGQVPSIACTFIERYLLDLYLQKDEQTIIQQMKEDKVHFGFGKTVPKNKLRTQIATLVPLLNESCSIAINTANYTHTVICKDDKDYLFEVKFPSDYQLMSGMNKKECELYFYTSLLSFSDDLTDTPNVPLPPLEKTSKNYYIQKGETYQIEAMNTHRYYDLQDGVYKQLTDTAHAEESIQNLFTLQADRRIEVDITLKLYGQKKVEFSMPLHKLLEYCRANGCKIFAGIESADTAQVKGTAILLNSTDGYNHLLAFKASPKLLERPEEHKMEINLHTFIPNHNIETLYHENKQNK